MVGLLLVALLAGDAIGALTQSGQADDLVTDAVTQEASATAAESTAEPAPRISLRAAASLVPEQANGAEESTAPVPRAVAEQDAAVAAEPVAAPEVLEPDGESDDGNAGLRLRELQIAVAAFFAALLAAMLWLARRRGRLQV